MEIWATAVTAAMGEVPTAMDTAQELILGHSGPCSPAAHTVTVDTAAAPTATADMETEE